MSAHATLAWAAIAVAAATGCGASQWEGGIHARMGWSDDRGLRVVEVPEGPARDAGLAVDDVVLLIDGVEIDGLPRDEVVAQLRGEVGTSVELVVERDGASRRVTIVRAPYE